MCDEHRNATLDAVALVKAQLDGDSAAEAFLLDSGDNRAQASMLAAIAAVLTAASAAPERRRMSWRTSSGDER